MFRSAKHTLKCTASLKKALDRNVATAVKLSTLSIRSGASKKSTMSNSANKTLLFQSLPVNLTQVQKRAYSTDEEIVVVPGMGDSITEGTLIEYTKKAGQQVKMDDIVAQIETDKVTVDVRTPAAGVVTELLAKEGSTVAVGAPLFKLKKGATAAAGAEPQQAPKQQAPQQQQAQPQQQQQQTQPQQTAKVQPATEQKPAEKKPEAPKVSAPVNFTGERKDTRVAMTRMRKRIAERLKSSQNTSAMLTTFNEIDMTNLMEMRNVYKDNFEKVHKVKLGFMSAFVKASANALLSQPAVNAVIEGDDIVYRDYVDISVAVSTPTGLVVPVIRDCQRLGFAGIEKTIGQLGERARTGSITLEEMQGGTFTISNGGVFGSLFGTPIINPPQSAILGMHSVQKRPIAVGDKIEIRPMMYVALTYDHRLIDGREAVTFLKAIKDQVEDPRRILLDLN